MQRVFPKRIIMKRYQKGRWSQENEKEKDAWEIFLWMHNLVQGKQKMGKWEVVFLGTRSWRQVPGSSTGALLLLLKFLRGLIILASSGLKRLTPLWEWRNVSKGWTFKAGFISTFFLPNFMEHYHRGPNTAQISSCCRDPWSLLLCTCDTL